MWNYCQKWDFSLIHMTYQDKHFQLNQRIIGSLALFRCVDIAFFSTCHFYGYHVFPTTTNYVFQKNTLQLMRFLNTRNMCRTISLKLWSGHFDWIWGIIQMLIKYEKTVISGYVTNVSSQSSFRSSFSEENFEPVLVSSLSITSFQSWLASPNFPVGSGNIFHTVTVCIMPQKPIKTA